MEGHTWGYFSTYHDACFVSCVAGHRHHNSQEFIPNTVCWVVFLFLAIQSWRSTNLNCLIQWVWLQVKKQGSGMHWNLSSFDLHHMLLIYYGLLRVCDDVVVLKTRATESAWNWGGHGIWNRQGLYRRLLVTYKAMVGQGKEKEHRYDCSLGDSTYHCSPSILFCG